MIFCPLCGSLLSGELEFISSSKYVGTEKCKSCGVVYDILEDSNYNEIIFTILDTVSR